MFHIYTVPVPENEKPVVHGPRISYVVDSEVDRDKQVYEIHKHNRITEIGLIYAGHGLHTIGTVSYQSEPGDILLYNVGQLHQDQSLRHEEPVRFYLCGIENLDLSQTALASCVAGNRHCRLRSGKYAAYLQQGYSLLSDDFRANAACAEQLADGFLKQLLAILEALARPQERPESENPDDSSLAQELRRYIDRNYAKNFSLGELADTFHVNRYHASHVFTYAFGYSPIQYRTRRRIGEAQVLLVETDFNITYISSMVGYDDPNWFSQAFTKAVGVSPRTFRKMNVFSQDKSQEGRK